MIATLAVLGVTAAAQVEAPQESVRSATGRAGAIGTVAQSLAGRLPDRVLLDRPHAEAATLWAMGHTWKARFDRDSWTFIPFFGADAPQNYPIECRVARCVIGGHELPIGSGAPRQVGTEVHLPRGAFVETLATELDGVEQSFVFEQLPQRGELVVEVAFASELAIAQTDRGLQFGNAHGSVLYEKAVAVDADGRRADLGIELVDGRARMVIPAPFVRSAALPLVLDPIVATLPNASVTTSQNLTAPDCATLQAPDQSLVVWQRQFSGTDQDCFAIGYLPGLSTTAFSQVAIDFTSDSWFVPRVASNAYSRRYLVVAERSDNLGTFGDIVGRLVEDDGTTLPQFDIAKEGVTSNLQGPHANPDVGGDPYPGVDSYFLVAWETEFTANNRNIHYRRVDADGVLQGAFPSTISSNLADDRYPSVSESNGTEYWWIAWQQRKSVSPFDWDIFARGVNWNGAIGGVVLDVATSNLNERRPSASARVYSAPNDPFPHSMFVYERLSSFGQSIGVRVYRGSTPVAFTVLQQFEGGGALLSRPQSVPNVSSDGTRFLISYHEENNQQLDAWATLMRWDQDSGVLRADERRVPLGTGGGDQFFSPSASFFAGGGIADDRYVLATLDDTSNEIPVVEYRGYVPGTFFSTFATACGPNAPPITASGEPVLGGTVTITVGGGGLTGTLFGGPGTFPLNALGCNCTLGVTQPILTTGPLVWTVPLNPGIVGAVLSVQGWSASGSSCLGFVDLSDTVDFDIR